MCSDQFSIFPSILNLFSTLDHFIIALQRDFDIKGWLFTVKLFTTWNILLGFPLANVDLSIVPVSLWCFDIPVSNMRVFIKQVVNLVRKLSIQVDFVDYDMGP